MAAAAARQHRTLLAAVPFLLATCCCHSPQALPANNQQATSKPLPTRWGPIKLRSPLLCRKTGPYRQATRATPLLLPVSSMQGQQAARSSKPPSCVLLRNCWHQGAGWKARFGTVFREHHGEGHSMVNRTWPLKTIQGLASLSKLHSTHRRTAEKPCLAVPGNCPGLLFFLKNLMFEQTASTRQKKAHNRLDLRSFSTMPLHALLQVCAVFCPFLRRHRTPSDNSGRRTRCRGAVRAAECWWGLDLGHLLLALSGELKTDRIAREVKARWPTGLRTKEGPVREAAALSGAPFVPRWCIVTEARLGSVATSDQLLARGSSSH